MKIDDFFGAGANEAQVPFTALDADVGKAINDYLRDEEGEDPLDRIMVVPSNSFEGNIILSGISWDYEAAPHELLTVNYKKTGAQDENSTNWLGAYWEIGKAIDPLLPVYALYRCMEGNDDYVLIYYRP